MSNGKNKYYKNGYADGLLGKPNSLNGTTWKNLFPDLQYAFGYTAGEHRRKIMNLELKQLGYGLSI